MFGKSVSEIRASLIRIIHAGHAARSAAYDLVKETSRSQALAGAVRSTALDEIERLARQELTDKVIKEVGMNEQKSRELTASLDNLGLTTEEKVLYFALLYKRAKELKPEAAVLWKKAGSELLDVQNALLNEQNRQGDREKVATIAGSLYLLGRDFNSAQLMFVAAYHMGSAEYKLGRYSDARNSWTAALELVLRAKSEASTVPEEVAQIAQAESIIRQSLPQIPRG